MWFLRLLCKILKYFARIKFTLATDNEELYTYLFITKLPIHKIKKLVFILKRKKYLIYVH